MATTALVTEILIVGLEVEAWIALIVLAIFGNDWADLGSVQSWTALVTLLVLAAAYVLGIVADRLADNAQRIFRLDLPNLGRERLQVLHASPGMATFLEYQRSRLRIARGTLLNVVPGGVAVSLYLILQTDASGWWVVAVVAVTAALTVATIFVTRRIGEAYEDRLLDASLLIIGERSKGEE